ncbi:hypothetical protein [Sporosarcina sp. Marseille-Q4943]|uniref:hypothetical protein n=1 Tax=Sporosarcina sp. Marseille-Q4943 TaxID=2942204 RepID=UPI00208DACCF|nr:hypothetical protein [Sporosarcina sp. Marseille-Q4943]
MYKKEIQRLSSSADDIVIEAQKYEVLFSNFFSKINEEKLPSELRNKFAVYREILKHAVAISELIEKSRADILVEGTLVQKINGHYAVQGVEVRKGTYIEFWVDELQNNLGGYFQPSIIDYDQSGYFMLSPEGKRLSLDGQLVRVK